MNPTKTLREVLKMSQQKFAHELGISLGSVRAYEGGMKVSTASLEAMKTLAVSRGFGDIAMAIAGEEHFGVSEVFAGGRPGSKIRLRAAARGRDLSDDLHAALDVIINNGSAEAVCTVEFLLRVLSDHAASAKGKK